MTSHIKRISLHHVSLLLAGLVFLHLAPRMLLAQDEPAPPEDPMDSEFKFMSGLVDMGLADFAEKALDKLLLRHPDQKERAKVTQAEILISRKKFDEADQLAKSLPPDNPKAQTISLAIANGYYRIGEVQKAKDLYQAFFAQFQNRAPTDPDLLRFYQESSYRFALMLKEADDLEGAIKAFDRVIQSLSNREVRRSVLSEQAQLCVDLALKTEDKGKRDENLNKAWKISGDLQWGGIDLAFGSSLITVARAEKARGSPAKAEQMLRDNLDILNSIDDALKEQHQSLSLSPLAGARFLIGEINEDKGMAAQKDPAQKDQAVGFLAKAINEYYNVFLKYGDSDWGSRAGLKVADLKGKLEALGKTVKIDLKDFKPRAGPEQFKFADNLYREKNYTQAVPEYLKILNQYPESDYSIQALSYLLTCYVNLGDTLSIKMLCGYLGERFAGKDTAANALRWAGKHYFDAKDEPMYSYIYGVFLDHFPEHPQAGGTIYLLAGLRKKAGDEAGRMAYLQRILDHYQRDKTYLQTLQLLAWENFVAEKFDDAARYFQLYVQEAQPGPDKVKAQFALATTYARLNRYKDALQGYNQIVAWLKTDTARRPFDISREAAALNTDLLEKSEYQLAFTLSVYPAPPDQQAGVKGRAIEEFGKFLTTYPNSTLAPRAMSGRGRMQLALGQFNEATATFNELARKYPQAEEGKNALYSLIKAAMEVGKVDIAREAFGKMFASKEGYSAGEFARIGQLMLAVKSYPEAAQAFQQVLDSKTEERALLERALFGLGQSNFELKDYPNAVKNLEDLTTRYPLSRLAFAAKFMLAGAYRETGQGEKAIAALTDVFKFAEQPELRSQASQELAMIEKQRGNKEAAFASYQRVVILEDPGNPRIRPIFEQCLLELIPLGMELQKYDDVVEACDLYLNNFPNSNKVEEVRKLKAEAKLRKTGASAPVSAASPVNP